MKEIPLGSINSSFYEKNGELYYKISPIVGLQSSVFGDFKVSESTVLKCSDKNLTFRVGLSKINMTFKPFSPGFEKVKVTKYIMGFLPLGCQFCEISAANKKYLYEQFTSS
ncbi:hypothetical protein [Teredinibacter purpureus]|uniref:hypothetical protein n=1 Tax=Teredinibacter purpureus TaxID=2731756 RepID=UPI0005F7FDD4|nr:hypothetical protein [Teredinibacter purpureus]